MASKAKAKASAKKEEKKEEPAPPKAEEPAAAAAPAEAEPEKKEVKRTGSNVFAMFSQSQIQEFKEAFTMLDQNRDGVICAEDLRSMYQNLGRDPSMNELEAMVKEAPGPLNFTMFLGLFGEKMHGTDPESTIISSFAMFDPEGKKVIAEEYLKELLTDVGDQFSESELRAMWKEAPVAGGQFDYVKYAMIIKRGKDEE